MVRDTDSDSIKMVVIKMMKGWVLGEDEGKFTGEELID